jgi:hypothetical protein
MTRRGPKSDAGKLVSSGNALKHGLRSMSPVVARGESQDEWETHRQALVQSFRPAGAMEHLLVDRIANLSWRLGRVARYEADVTATEREGVEREINQVLQLQLEARRYGVYSLAQAEENVAMAESEAATAAEDNADEQTMRKCSRELFQAKDVLTTVSTLQRRTEALRALPGSEEIEKICRYEAHLERSMFRTMKELQRLQENRVGSPPIAVDVKVRHEPKTFDMEEA